MAIQQLRGCIVDNLVVLAIVLAFLLFVLAVVCVSTVAYSAERMHRERRRLERVLHDYNIAFEDDYKPF